MNKLKGQNRIKDGIQIQTPGKIRKNERMKEMKERCV